MRPSSLTAIARSARRWTALAAVLLVAGLTPAARAAWSPPQTVSGGNDAVDALSLASGPSGALLAWHHNDLVPPSRTIFGATGASDAIASLMGPFGPERALPSSYTSAPLLSLGEGNVAQLILRRTGPNTSAPEVALGTVAGAFGAPLPVHSTVWAGRASLAGNWQGELLLAWISSTGAGHRQLWASVRPTGGRFQKPQLLSSSANGLSVTAAVGSPSHGPVPGGFASDMVVVFDSKQGRLLARIRPHGAGWHSTLQVGPAAVGTSNTVAVPHIGRDGRVVVAWSHQQLSEGGPVGPAYTQVAIKPARAHAFSRPQTLERDPAASASGEPVLLEIAGRDLILAFIAQPGPAAAAGTPSVVKVSYSRGNAFAPAGTISAAGQWATGLAGQAEGSSAIISWIGGPNPPFSALEPGPAVYEALAEPGQARLGSPQQVSPAERPSSAASMYAGRLGRWIVAWAARPSYRSASAPGPVVVRVAECGAFCNS